MKKILIGLSEKKYLEVIQQSKFVTLKKRKTAIFLIDST